MILAPGAPPTKSVKPGHPGEVPSSLLPASRLSVPGAVAAVGGQRAGRSAVGSIVRTSPVTDEIALQRSDEAGGQRAMMRIEAGVEMGDRDLALLGADLGAGRGKLAEGGASIPRDDAGHRRSPTAGFLVIEGADRRSAGRHAPVAAAILVVPLLLYVGLDGQDLRAAGCRKGPSPPNKVMGVVPGIFRAAGFGAELEPGGAAIGAGPQAGTWLRRYCQDRLDVDLRQGASIGSRQRSRRRRREP